MPKYNIHAFNGAGEKFVLNREKSEFIPASRRPELHFRAESQEDCRPYFEAVKARGPVSGIYNPSIVPVL